MSIPTPAAARDQDESAVAPLFAIAIPLARAVSTERHDALLAIARERAPDPSVFDEHPPVFFEAIASNNTLDHYSTRMMPSTLKNYAKDAAAGVAFQDSHSTFGMQSTLGRTIDGKYTAGRGDNPHRATLTAFTQPTLSERMAEFANRVRSGLAADVSVGWMDGRMECSICGKEMFDWWARGQKDPCFHIPGVEYPIVDKEGKATGEVRVAEGLIEDAHLREVSTVYKGATEGAGIVGYKARMLADAGLLVPEVRGVVEARYHLHLPGHGRSWPGVANPARAEEETMADYTQEQFDEGIARARAEAVAPVRAALAEAGRELADGDAPVEHIRALGAELTRLRPLADAGTAYRTDLIASAIEEGIRAFATDFEKESEEEELKSLSIDGIKRRIALYKKAAGKNFDGEGRKTEDGAGKTTPTQLASRRRARSDRVYSS